MLGPRLRQPQKAKVRLERERADTHQQIPALNLASMDFQGSVSLEIVLCSWRKRLQRNSRHDVLNICFIQCSAQSLGFETLEYSRVQPYVRGSMSVWKHWLQPIDPSSLSSSARIKLALLHFWFELQRSIGIYVGYQLIMMCLGMKWYETPRVFEGSGQRPPSIRRGLPQAITTPSPIPVTLFTAWLAAGAAVVFHPLQRLQHSGYPVNLKRTKETQLDTTTAPLLLERSCTSWH